MKFPHYYRNHGFMVHIKAIPPELILAADIPQMKSIFKRVKAAIVFNAKPVEKIDPKKAERKQLVTKHYDLINRERFTEEQKGLLTYCEATVKEFIEKLLPAVEEFKMIESVLHSRSNSKERQQLHADLGDELKDSAALALVALEDNTGFIMCRGSHLDSTKIDDLGVSCLPRVYKMNMGDVLIFHPNLIHAGDRYTQSNLRLHYYAIDKKKEYQLNLTFPVEVNISKKVYALGRLRGKSAENLVRFHTELKEKKARKYHLAVGSLAFAVAARKHQKKKLKSRKGVKKHQTAPKRPRLS